MQLNAKILPEKGENFAEDNNDTMLQIRSDANSVVRVDAAVNQMQEIPGSSHSVFDVLAVWGNSLTFDKYCYHRLN